MDKRAKHKIGWIIFFLIIIIAFASFLLLPRLLSHKSTNKLDAFAQCLKKQGVVFYGAFWCPHCQREKALFGSSAQYLPYTECSTPDGQGQLQICINNNISSYPSFVFADGSRLTGETPLADLAAKSGCALTQ
jgi:histidinol phosphatase-like enzyme